MGWDVLQANERATKQQTLKGGHGAEGALLFKPTSIKPSKKRFCIKWKNNLVMLSHLISAGTVEKQTATGTAWVSGTAWDGMEGGAEGYDKKGTADRHRQMSLFGISTMLQRERLAWSYPQCLRQMKWTPAPVPTWAFPIPLQHTELSGDNRKSNN